MEATDGWFAFRGAFGAQYTCRIQNNSVVLNWKNGQRSMSSSGTRFEIDHETLFVQPAGLGAWKFRRSGATYEVIE
jgi:hypothetical protein